MYDFDLNWYECLIFKIFDFDLNLLLLSVYCRKPLIATGILFKGVLVIVKDYQFCVVLVIMIYTMFCFNSLVFFLI